MGTNHINGTVYAKRQERSRDRDAIADAQCKSSLRIRLYRSESEIASRWVHLRESIKKSLSGKKKEKNSLSLSITVNEP